jgi:hypothetical protein
LDPPPLTIDIITNVQQWGVRKLDLGQPHT